ncbi:MAG: type VII secretion-associated protein [Actinomycetota bacterium]|nr:type VII secretion-associated protein [Actinomycetota bacterium]
MTVTVEVGPVTVRGPHPAPPDLVAAAVGCIDDPVALVAEQPVEVGQLWRDVLRVAAGAHPAALMLVVPTWWPAARVEVVADAARRVSAQVDIVSRTALLAGTEGSAGSAVVEFAEDVVVLAAPGADAVVLARDDDAVCEQLGAPTGVLLDVPAGVRAPAPALSARLRAVSTTVRFSDRRAFLDADRPDPPPVRGRAEPPRRRVAVLAGAALALAAAAASWWLPDPGAAPAQTVVLVEGRAAVRVPAHWAVQRITGGPGSARVRIAPGPGLPALHVTQASSTTAATPEQVAESLRRALQSEPDGVFVDFDPAAEVGGRSAITYRERRTDSETLWAVVIDGTLRIAVGCQSAPARRDAITEVCEQAVRSAHAVR